MATKKYAKLTPSKTRRNVVEVMVTKWKDDDGDTLLCNDYDTNLVKKGKLDTRLLIENLVQEMSKKEWEQFLRDNMLYKLTDDERDWVLKTIQDLKESTCTFGKVGEKRENDWNKNHFDMDDNNEERKEFSIWKSLFERLIRRKR